MGEDFLRALALVMVIEGMLPFLSPRRFRESLLRAASLEDRPLRLLGLVAMLSGAGLLHFLSTT
ncbi:DUF2065 domain-containing protein [Stagnimonas aquatica]|uniref:DUF2065 domain-containing protein n=1 Tax=Stagnimonas aquatica TaxID=2689987 RepID=A0A3N0V5B1_9GAMM|nr:DUF2065 domain-containing protein [Stagnimonas aquatica]ROH87865.1 DUF2065 domain-containing protein [Stagnimonas aquatica]